MDIGFDSCRADDTYYSLLLTAPFPFGIKARLRLHVDLS